MEWEIKDLVSGLSYQQLLRLQFDLNHGGLYVRRLVDTRIKELESTSKKSCASCGCSIDENVAPYTLVFGPTDLRKKASCCGMDCFSEFMQKIKVYEGKATDVESTASATLPKTVSEK